MHIRWHFAQFLELWWWRFYLARREKSTYLQWKRNYWTDFIQKSGVLPAPGTQVLDAGCGPAGIFTALSDCPVDAVDPLLPEYARKLPHFAPGRYPNVRFFELPLEQFHPQKEYRLVYCLNAINHVADLNRCLDILSGCVARDGCFLLSVDAHNHRFLRRLFRWIPGDALHPHQHDHDEYVDMLKKRGFSNIRSVLLRKAAIFNYYLFVATY